VTIIPEGISFRFYFELTDSAGLPLDITGYQSVIVNVTRPASTALALVATVTDDDTGKGYADATPAQMVGVGDWATWVTVTWATGKIVKTHAVALQMVKAGTVGVVA